MGKEDGTQREPKNNGKVRQLVPTDNQWHSEGWAWPGTCPAESTMFVLLLSHDLAQSMHERKANGLVYSWCPANTNDLAMPLLTTFIISKSLHDVKAVKECTIFHNACGM